MIEHPLPPSAQEEIRALLQQRQKIEAIKVLRQHTGLDLKDAKDRVEAIEREMGLPASGTPGSPGCLALVAAVLILGLLAWWWLIR
jgi:ribosomal L7/L12-like protein